MYCSSCGAKLNEKAAFCSSCGASVKKQDKKVKEENIEVTLVNNSTNPVTKKSSGTATASLVLGIVSIVFGVVMFIISMMYFAYQTGAENYYYNYDYYYVLTITFINNWAFFRNIQFNKRKNKQRSKNCRYYIKFYYSSFMYYTYSTIFYKCNVKNKLNHSLFF